jgi:hypothetical protein
VSSLLGGYDHLAHGYPVSATARWAVEHVFDLALYLGLLGGIAVPAALAMLYRGARAGSGGDAAFLGTFMSASVTALVVVAAFSAGPFGFGRLHDRYLFYVVPLWLVLLALWVARGAPRSRPAAVVTAAAFVAFVLVMPYSRLIVPDEGKLFDGTGTAVLATVGHWLAHAHGISGRWLLLAGAAASGVWLVTVPKRLAWTLLVVVAGSFVAGGEIMWRRTIDDSRKDVFANQHAATRAWVDRAVPAGAKVTLVTVNAGACRAGDSRYAFLFTEFFNDRIERVPFVSRGLTVGPATHPLRVAPDGLLHTQAGSPLRARFVVLPGGLTVAGRRLAAGTTAPLVLWQTGGIVRLTDAHSDAQVVAKACT